MDAEYKYTILIVASKVSYAATILSIPLVSYPHDQKLVVFHFARLRLDRLENEICKSVLC
jgi:hypothetical protein